MGGPLPLPRALSPSALSTFTGCGLQFRFSTVERLPETPSLPATRGTLVHAALEHLFALPARERTAARVEELVAATRTRFARHPELTGLELDDAADAALFDDVRSLVERYFTLEDPRSIEPVGLELKLEVEVGGVRVRGVIDRLDLVDGELVVTDYKTGRAPSDAYARSHLSGVQLYSLMCERFFGRRPIRVQLLHLAEPVAVVTEPTGQSSTGLARRIAAVWQTIESACEARDFRPRPSARCDWCSFARWCPSFGGDPEAARPALLGGSETTGAAHTPQLELVPA